MGYHDSQFLSCFIGCQLIRMRLDHAQWITGFVVIQDWCLRILKKHGGGLLHRVLSSGILQDWFGDEWESI